MSVNLFFSIKLARFYLAKSARQGERVPMLLYYTNRFNHLIE